MLKKILFLSMAACLAQAQEVVLWDAHNDLIPTQTIFYQGMGGAQTQGAKYTGSYGFIASTGEHVLCSKAIDLLQNVYTKPEIEEVIPAPTIPWHWSHITLNPKKILYALYSRLFHLGTRHAHYYYGITVKNIPNNSGNHTIAAYTLDIPKINVGQERDIANHALRYESCIKEYPQSAIIHFGVSRGAATTFQSLAKLAKEKVDLSSSKLCILEGCFDNVTNVMKYRHPWIFKFEKVQNFIAALASKIMAFKKDGPSPLKAVADFPKALPVAFITSRKDEHVSPLCTKNLVKELLKHGHPSIYFLELKNSRHPSYMFDDPTDIENYLAFIHGLYKKYGLPHIKKYAEQGTELVEACHITNSDQLA